MHRLARRMLDKRPNVVHDSSQLNSVRQATHDLLSFCRHGHYLMLLARSGGRFVYYVLCCTRIIRSQGAIYLQAILGLYVLSSYEHSEDGIHRPGGRMLEKRPNVCLQSRTLADAQTINTVSCDRKETTVVIRAGVSGFKSRRHPKHETQFV